MRLRRAWQKTVTLGVLWLAVAVSAGAQDPPKSDPQTDQPQSLRGGLGKLQHPPNDRVRV